MKKPFFCERKLIDYVRYGNNFLAAHEPIHNKNLSTPTITQKGAASSTDVALFLCSSPDPFSVKNTGRAHTPRETLTLLTDRLVSPSPSPPASSPSHISYTPICGACESCVSAPSSWSYSEDRSCPLPTTHPGGSWQSAVKGKS